MADQSDIERERDKIREAFTRLEGGDSTGRASLEKLLLELRRWHAGERPDCPDLAAIPPNFRPYLLELAKRRNQPLPPSEEMKRDLRLIDWGTRVLLLRDKGVPAMEAMHLAREDMGADAISDQAMREFHWNPFCELVKKRGFVPYFEFDEVTGTLAPTRFVPASLKARRGRPPKK